MNELYEKWSKVDWEEELARQEQPAKVADDIAEEGMAGIEDREVWDADQMTEAERD